MEVIKKKNSTEDTKNPVDDKNVGKNKKKDTAALSNDTTESGSEVLLFSTFGYKVFFL